jgi:hypothetical protein
VACNLAVAVKGAIPMSTLGGIYNALIDSEPFAADGIPSMFDQVQNFLAVTDTLANLVGGCFTIESFNRKLMFHDPVGSSSS